MKVWAICLLLVLSVLPARRALSREDRLAIVDSLCEAGGLDNYKRCIELSLEALQASGDNYEANWKCAKVYREYGKEAKEQDLEDWKRICARSGKEGMKYAQKAIQLDGNRVEGHYYFGLNVGIYSDGVSRLTALREGLKGKTQGSFEKAYELDKMYGGAGPILALGRFWAVVPWPFQDKKKALKYYRQFQATEHFAVKDHAKIYLAELLLDLKGKQNRAEAEALLREAAESEEPYYRDWARRLLREQLSR